MTDTPSKARRMSLAEQRDIALGAARSQLRRMGKDPQLVEAHVALRVLDDLLRSEPALIASQWYDQASDHQIALFCREWHRRLK